ncbi:asparagine synthase (glutamine-hydrolyzing) [Oricola sp.]|uniref:asparagine synthase (glutamine-hydrolyzing) n=1 Tax=Oricola sp. TaxID=1979950 RepID=UPI003BA8D68C
MCGIAGIWRFGKPVTEADERDVRRMTAAIAHRGPDGDGHRTLRDVALGHRRLAILDPTERAAQPMSTPDGAGTLVYNGEVYNFRELRAELEREGVAFVSSGDAEVVLRALHQWGPEAAVPRFNGMFALAYHDARTATLWLARDRLGIKPMSLATMDGRLAFASEDKGVLAAMAGNAEIDARALTLRMMVMSNANDTSLFSGVERLRPGTILRCHGTDCEEIEYWQPLAAFDPDRLLSNRRSDAEKMETLSALVQGSVALHLAADTPVAACLSGGVDSGMVTAIAARGLPGMSAFVADPDKEPNEVAAASLTARQSGATLHPVGMDRDTFLRNWPTAVFALETMTYAFSDTALLAIAQRCRADGIPVLLSGEGADELFGGYLTHRVTARRWRRADPPWSLFRSKRSRDRLARQLQEAPFHGSPVEAGSGDRLPGFVAAAPFAALSQSACASAVSGLPRYRDRGAIASGLHDMGSHMQELLNRLDRLSMLASVEIRVPFLENSLIDFALHLPGRDLYRKRTSKYLLKQAARSWVPRQNIEKSKLGFPLTSTYSTGTEALLRDGVLKDVMRWSRRDAEAATHHAKTDWSSRNQLVAAELLTRIFAEGERPDDLGEKLVAMTRDEAA